MTKVHLLHTVYYIIWMIEIFISLIWAILILPTIPFEYAMNFLQVKRYEISEKGNLLLCYEKGKRLALNNDEKGFEELKPKSIGFSNRPFWKELKRGFEENRK